MKTQIMSKMAERAKKLKNLEEYCVDTKQYADAEKYRNQWLEVLMMIDEVEKIKEPIPFFDSHPLAPEVQA